MVRISAVLGVAILSVVAAGAAGATTARGQGQTSDPQSSQPIRAYPVAHHARPQYAQAGSGTFRCESVDGRTRECNADTRGGVRLTRQLSRTQCVQGENWGYGRHGIWVSQGCRAEFVTGYGDDRPGGWDGWGGGPGGPGVQTVRCESNDGRSRQCALDTRGGVRLVKQISRTQCQEGRNWGWNREGVWVAQGCRGEFASGGGGGWRPGPGGGRPGGGPGPGGGPWQGPEQVVRCESNDGRHRQCRVPVRYGAELVRQMSRTQCVRGQNWGWDRGGVWVDGGCRAEFRVR